MQEELAITYKIVGNYSMYSSCSSFSILVLTLSLPRAFVVFNPLYTSLISSVVVALISSSSHSRSMVLLSLTCSSNSLSPVSLVMNCFSIVSANILTLSSVVCFDPPLSYSEAFLVFSNRSYNLSVCVLVGVYSYSVPPSCFHRS